MTIIRKDYYGAWEAQDQIELGDNRVLQVGTRKVRDGSIVTRATVHIDEGGHLSHRVFTDFSQCLKTSRDRCTEKNVTAQHAEAMSKLPELKEAIVAWYAQLKETV